MGSRKYIVGAIAFALLIWSPLEHSPAGVAILILVPVATWFLLGWIWQRWQPDSKTERRLQRSLAAATAGIFLVFAIMVAMSDYHIGNTKVVQTRDGFEAVGDDIVLPGPDWGFSLMLLGFSGFAFKWSIAKDIWNEED